MNESVAVLLLTLAGVLCLIGLAWMIAQSPTTTLLLSVTFIPAAAVGPRALLGALVATGAWLALVGAIVVLAGVASWLPVPTGRGAGKREPWKAASRPSCGGGPTSEYVVVSRGTGR